MQHWPPPNYVPSIVRASAPIRPGSTWSVDFAPDCVIDTYRHAGLRLMQVLAIEMHVHEVGNIRRAHGGLSVQVFTVNEQRVSPELVAANCLMDEPDASDDRGVPWTTWKLALQPGYIVGPAPNVSGTMRIAGVYRGESGPMLVARVTLYGKLVGEAKVTLPRDGWWLDDPSGPSAAPG